MLDFEEQSPYQNFLTVFDGQWIFKSTKTGKEYFWFEFDDSEYMPETLKYLFLQNYDRAVKMSTYELFDVFVKHWLLENHRLRALMWAENAHKTTLVSATDQDRKKLGKLYKKADDAYETAFKTYFYRYGDW